MATRRQRSRKLLRRLHHQGAQRERLRVALGLVEAGASQRDIDRHMAERGYEPDPRTGMWRRTPEAAAERGQRRGPSWTGVLARRKAKSKAKRGK